MSDLSREEAFALLKKYNQDAFHIQHALTVEAVMKWYARELGYGSEEEHWGLVGLLHDIDFELYPEEPLPESTGTFKRGRCVRRYHSWRCFSWIWNYRRMWGNAGCGTGT